MYKEMASILKPCSKGKFKLDIFEIDHNNWVAHIQGISCGRYARLKFKGECIMSDTDMEKRTNEYFVHHAHGDVLIGGLGIGLVLLAIQDKADVHSITVIEKYPEVIEIVGSQLQLNEKVKIICDDVYTWEPENDCRYDCIYMDIWGYINSDIYEQRMKPIKAKYNRYLKPKTESPNRFNKCWAEYEAKNGIRL